MAPEIVRCQFDACARVREQLAFSDRADAAVSVAEGPEDLEVVGPVFEPEVGLQRCGRDDAFDEGVPSDEE